MAAGTFTVLDRFDAIATETAQPAMGSGDMGPHMMRGMMDGQFPPGISPEALPDPGGAGAELAKRYCTQCHDLPSPSLHTAEEWPSVAARMFHRMERMADGRQHLGMRRRHMVSIQAPPPAEQDAILAYLTQHAIRPAAPHEPGSPETPELTLFRQTCSRCHALPHSASHTADEWPLVVERMRKNMERMGRAGISDQERDSIIGYLQKHAR
jgi:mono/diheme cytochrome c family protein